LKDRTPLSAVRASAARLTYFEHGVGLADGEQRSPSRPQAAEIDDTRGNTRRVEGLMPCVPVGVIDLPAARPMTGQSSRLHAFM